MTYMISLVCAMVGMACYLQCTSHDFVFDDLKAITRNRDVTDGVGLRLGPIFRNDFWGVPVASIESHKSWRPLTTLSFRMNAGKGPKLNPTPFHVTNVIIYGLTCAIFPVAIQQTLLLASGDSDSTRRNRIVLATSLLFTVHPIHTEAVSSLVGRAEVLSGFFFFAAMLSYFKAVDLLTPRASLHMDKRGMAYLFLTVVLTLTSVLCKEQGVTVLGVCLVWDVVVWCDYSAVLFPYHQPKKNSKKRHGGKDVDKYVARKRASFLTVRMPLMLLAAAALLYLRLYVSGFTTPDFKQSAGGLAYNIVLTAPDATSRLLTMLHIYSINLRLLLLPIGLSVSYVGSVGLVTMEEACKPDVAIPLVAMVVGMGLWLVIGATAKSRINRHALLMAGALLVVPFLPSSNIFVGVGFTVAERVLFLPSVGICLLLGVVATEVLNNTAQARRSILKGAGLVLVLIFAALTFRRNEDWTDGSTIWKANIKTQPRNPESYYSLGEWHFSLSEYATALEYYTKAVSIEPDWAMLQNSMGSAVQRQKGPAVALPYFKRALELDDHYIAAHYNIGTAYTRLRNYEKSEYHLKTALNMPLRYDKEEQIPNIYMNLGILYKKQGKMQEAEKNFLRAIQMQPNNAKAHSNYANLLSAIGRLDDAVKQYQLAIQSDPTNPQPRKNYGTMLFQANKLDEAEVQFKMAASLSPTPPYIIDLAKITAMLGRYEEAKIMFKDALRLDPGNKMAQISLQQLETVEIRNTEAKHKKKKESGRGNTQYEYVQ